MPDRLEIVYGPMSRVLMLILVVLISPFVGPTLEDFGPYNGYINMHYVSTLGFLVAALAVIGMWLVQVTLIVKSKSALVSADQAGVEGFLELRKQLEEFLLVAGIILVLGTLSVAATRDFAVAFKNSFPREFVVIFGGAYSVLLAIAYAPAYAEFQKVGRELRDKLLLKFAPTSLTELGRVESRAKHKDKLDNILHLEIRDWASVGTGFAIIGPVLVSLISTLATGK